MRYLGLGFFTLFLAGCVALPLPLQVASWAATGISYMATGKSVSDQVLSAVASRDCALHRVALGEDICFPNALDDSDIMVASGGDGGNDDPTPARRLRESMIDLAESLDDDLLPADNAAADDSPSAQLDTVLLAMAETLNDIAPAAGPDNAPEIQRGKAKHYLIIGSYRQLRDAEQARVRHAALPTAVRMVLREGALLYQVTAGPFSRPDALELDATLAATGEGRRKIALLCADRASAPPCAADDAPVQLTARPAGR